MIPFDRVYTNNFLNVMFCNAEMRLCAQCKQSTQLNLLKTKRKLESHV